MKLSLRSVLAGLSMQGDDSDGDSNGMEGDGGGGSNECEGGGDSSDCDSNSYHLPSTNSVAKCDRCFTPFA